MSERVVINPVTRISGFMGIDVQIENHKIIDAKVEGLMFRGFEMMLNGRAPLDAISDTVRICGICSTAHGLAATLALEQAMGVAPTEQGVYLRDFLHGCEFIQNHLRQFYQFTIPDFVKLPEQYTIYRTNEIDYRLPKEINDQIVNHYFESLDISRLAHQMLAVFGGKAPHNHGVFVGGTTARVDADDVVKSRAILSEVLRFSENVMIPDVSIIARYYPEYYENGKGYGNLLTYGCFDRYPSLGTLYVNPSIYVDGEIKLLDPDRITEEID